MKIGPTVGCLVLAAAIAAQTQGLSFAADAVPVTVDNFVRAETDLYFSGMIKDFGFGKLGFHREPTSISDQTVIRMNRDTLYGGGIFDLDAGPVTITLPDSGERFMSMQVINEDEYTPAVFYGAGKHCPSTASGRSASTMPKGISSQTSTTPIRSTASRRRKATTDRSPSSLAVVTARSRIVCQSRMAGTTRCDSTVRGPRSSTAVGNSLRQRLSARSAIGT